MPSTLVTTKLVHSLATVLTSFNLPGPKSSEIHSIDVPPDSGPQPILLIKGVSANASKSNASDTSRRSVPVTTPKGTDPTISLENNPRPTNSASDIAQALTVVDIMFSYGETIPA